MKYLKNLVQKQSPERKKSVDICDIIGYNNHYTKIKLNSKAGEIMEHEISIDIGYGHCKVMYEGKLVKFPMAISYANDLGVTYGEMNSYEFEGKHYSVGSDASDESFSTTDYKLLYKFAPLIVFHILSKFDRVDTKTPIVVNTGLSIVDWGHKDEFIDRLSKIVVDEKEVDLEVTLIPQGAGCAVDWVENQNDSEYPSKLSVIDIGFNTINLIYMEKGRLIRQKSKPYPGHGIVSIIKTFSTFLENKYAMNFSQQEVNDIFLDGEFTYNGEDQEDVRERIVVIKEQFVTKLFNTILVDAKKTFATSNVVLIGGGGAYMLENIPMPPNVQFVESPYEYSNVRGYSL